MQPDASTKRFLALLFAPLFLLLRTKLGVEVPDSVQELLVVSVIAYVGGSHAKEAVVRRAEVAGAKAADAVTAADAAAIIKDAAKVAP